MFPEEIENLRIENEQLAMENAVLKRRLQLISDKIYQGAVEIVKIVRGEYVDDSGT